MVGASAADQERARKSCGCVQERDVFCSSSSTTLVSSTTTRAADTAAVSPLIRTCTTAAFKLLLPKPSSACRLKPNAYAAALSAGRTSLNTVWERTYTSIGTIDDKRVFGSGRAGDERARQVQASGNAFRLAASIDEGGAPAIQQAVAIDGDCMSSPEAQLGNADVPLRERAQQRRQPLALAVRAVAELDAGPPRIDGAVLADAGRATCAAHHAADGPELRRHTDRRFEDVVGGAVAELEGVACAPAVHVLRGSCSSRREAAVRPGRERGGGPCHSSAHQRLLANVGRRRSRRAPSAPAAARAEAGSMHPPSIRCRAGRACCLPTRRWRLTPTHMSRRRNYDKLALQPMRTFL